MSAHKTSVLIVDDDPAMQEVLTILMDEWGFSSRIAVNGVEGAEIADSWQPDIVISDVVMPDCSGLELLRNSNPFPLGCGSSGAYTIVCGPNTSENA